MGPGLGILRLRRIDEAQEFLNLETVGDLALQVFQLSRSLGKVSCVILCNGCLKLALKLLLLLSMNYTGQHTRQEYETHRPLHLISHSHGVRMLALMGDARGHQDQRKNLLPARKRLCQALSAGKFKPRSRALARTEP